MYLSGMRAPKVTAVGAVDIVNNYDYDNIDPMRIEARYTPAKRQGSAMTVNVIRNLRELGPANGTKPTKPYGMSIDQYDLSEALPTAYLEGNIHPFRTTDRHTSISGQWAGVNTGKYKGAVKLKAPVDTPAIRTTSAQQAKAEILTYGGPSFVLRNGVLTDVRDGLLKSAADAALTGSGPSDLIVGWGKKKNWDWPAIPKGGISEKSFWTDYFNPWRDAYYPGAAWDEYVDGYQIIELYLNAWVPDFASLLAD